MKSIAKREKAAKRHALAQVAQLQGLLQGLQMGASNNFMANQPMFTGSLNRPAPTLFFGNMLPHASAIPNMAEDDSIESVIIPDDI